MALAPLPSRSASRRSTAASALSSNNPPYLVSVNATLLCPAHSETSRTLQPAATMIATKLCRSPWKVMSSSPARSTGRPQDSASPGAEKWATRGCGEYKGICSLVNRLREVLLKPPHD
jgi:hypothetical protein